MRGPKPYVTIAKDGEGQALALRDDSQGWRGTGPRPT